MGKIVFYFKIRKFLIAYCVTIHSSVSHSPHQSLFCFALTAPSSLLPDLARSTTTPRRRCFPSTKKQSFPPLFATVSCGRRSHSLQYHSLNLATLLIPERHC
ncbi:hypothetical protein TSUD_151490 [Trifolium subterraneum]|uniref:Uncharacterized protein n=1 Tax=Trifolium subterraneum TaxID=3900 RepID=A0A2Z6NIE1_TRISU|nr:hypothetical protein TSUD_151490 [Trifolium subterraneum]